MWPRGRDFWNVETVKKGREVKWGEENSWLLFLSWSRSLRITDPFHPSIFFSECPNSVLTGKLLSAFLNAPNVYNFLCKEPGLEKQKQTGSEGRGKWEVTEARAWRAQMGNGGRLCAWERWGVWRWKTHMVLVTKCYAFHVLLFQMAPQLNFQDEFNYCISCKALLLFFFDCITVCSGPQVVFWWVNWVQLHSSNMIMKAFWQWR